MKNRLDIIFEDAAEILKKINFDWLEGKTVLVTGATGLLGTHILATLALLKERGMRIRVIGHYHSHPALYTFQIRDRGGPGFYLAEHPDEFVDVIIHAAGYAQPSVFTKNPAETIRINTTWTQDLFRWLKPGGKFLFVSSSEIYSGADPGWCVCEESAGASSPVYHPRACYIEGKRCGEAITNAYRQNGVDAKSARLGITYGPGTRANDQRAMCQFIRQALTENRIDMKYSGGQAQSFCYIRDAVEMIWQILLHGTYPVYNVGSPFMTSMYEIASRIATITGATICFPVTNSEMPGSRGVRMSMAGAEMEFGKLPYVGLEEGLQRTIDWNRGFYV
jgi:UDP-glucuronate decarboxylase